MRRFRWVGGIAAALTIALVSGCMEQPGATSEGGAGPSAEALEPPEVRRDAIVATGSVLTDGYDLGRRGANLAEATLTPANVNVSAFGQLAFRNVDGLVTAQILYARGVDIAGVSKNVIYTATSKNNVYAYDADELSTNPNAGLLWSRLGLMAPAQRATVPGASDAAFTGTATFGVLGTPVIDPVSNALYVVTAYQASPSTWGYKLFALDARSGATVGSVVIAGAFGSATFSANQNLQRAGLALVNGRIIVAFALVADAGP